MMRNTKAVFGIALAALFVFGLGVFSACKSNTDDEDLNNKWGGVSQKPVIESVSKDTTVLKETPLSLVVVAKSTDGGELSYQWYSTSSKDSEGAKIDGATYASYSFISLNKTNYYYVIVTNTKDGKSAAAKSNIITVSITEKQEEVSLPKAPVITKQPEQTIKALKDGDVMLSVSASSQDEGALSYQWYRAADATAEGVAISGATAASYTVKAESEAYYYIVVMNTKDGQTASATSGRTHIVLTDNPEEVVPPKAPVITKQPEQVVKVQEDKEVTLSVSASSDDGVLSYQWYRAADATAEGVAISGATSASCTMKANSEAYYYVVIMNTKNGQTVSVTSGRTHIEITSNTTNDTEDNTTNNPTEDNTTNGTTNDTEEVTQPKAPVILEQPVGGTVEKGGTYMFSVKASVNNDGVLSYQWYWTKDASIEGMAIDGATSAKYELKADDDSAEAYYYVIVTNTLNGLTKYVKSTVVKIEFEQISVPNKPDDNRPDDKEPGIGNYVYIVGGITASLLKSGGSEKDATSTGIGGKAWEIPVSNGTFSFEFTYGAKDAWGNEYGKHVFTIMSDTDSWSPDFRWGDAVVSVGSKKTLYVSGGDIEINNLVVGMKYKVSGTLSSFDGTLSVTTDEEIPPDMNLVLDGQESVQMTPTSISEFEYDIPISSSAKTIQFSINYGDKWWGGSHQLTVGKEIELSASATKPASDMTFECKADASYTVHIVYNNTTGKMSVAVTGGSFVDTAAVCGSFENSSWEPCWLESIDEKTGYFYFVADDTKYEFKIQEVFGRWDKQYNGSSSDKVVAAEKDRSPIPVRLTYNTMGKGDNAKIIDCVPGTTYRMTVTVVDANKHIIEVAVQALEEYKSEEDVSFR